MLFRSEADKDTIALYHFDEGNGEVLKDSSGNNHHGKIVGAKWVRVGPPDAVGQTSSSIQLKLRKRIQGNSQVVQALAFHPQQPLLASASKSRDLFLWDTNDGKQAGEIKGNWKHSPASIAFAPDGKRLLVSDDLYSLTEWDVAQIGRAHV